MKVNHPTIPGASKDVPDEMAEKWLSNGWTPAVEPEAKAEPAPVKKAAPRPSRKK